MPRHIAVPALLPHQRSELETLNNAEDCQFHALLDVPTLVEPGRIDFEALMDRCRQALDQLNVPLTGLIAHWDFPTSVLVPLLSAERGLPSPSLRSVLTCEHKYWSRLAQREVIPECVPDFCSVDPFASDPLAQVTLPFPFWIKPVKAFSSQLGFRIDNERDFQHAIGTIRQGIRHFGDAFDQALQHVDLPDALQHAGGNTCIAEAIMNGVQAAPEGSVFKGEFAVHGTFDMHRDEQRYDSLLYPSALPEAIQQRMQDACQRFLHHIDFDNGCFNAEFLWDEANDRLQVVEFNTRISQSHSDMFIMVDGVSNHEVPLDILLGRRPRMPHRQGRYAVAGKFLLSHDEDAIVDHVASDRVIQTLQTRFPGTRLELDIEPGMRLSDLPNRESYTYPIGALYLGADSYDALRERHRICLEALDFDFVPLPVTSPHATPRPSAG